MRHEGILSALADPTRRAVLDRLRGGALPVSRIAEGLPVTRPAVSQHLKCCLDAGLVSVTRQGTRNLYALAPGGAAPLVEWLTSLRAEGAAPEGVIGRDTRLTPGEAWTLFCDDLPIWWPVARVSLSARREGALPLSVTLDGQPGGWLREVMHDGTEGCWAAVRGVDPGARLELDWTLGAAEAVTVLVHAAPGGARLELSHGGAQAEMWESVLDRFAAAANSSLSNF
jgi:DNA-binding transcriptional ArsR family regulator